LAKTNSSEIANSIDPSHEIILDYESVLEETVLMEKCHNFLFSRTRRSQSIMHAWIRFGIEIRSSMMYLHSW